MSLQEQTEKYGGVSMIDATAMIHSLQQVQSNPKSLKCVCDAGENKWHSVPETSQPTFEANWMIIGVTCNRAAMENQAAIPGFPESEFLLFACRRCGTLKALKI